MRCFTTANMEWQQRVNNLFKQFDFTVSRKGFSRSFEKLPEICNLDDFPSLLTQHLSLLGNFRIRNRYSNLTFLKNSSTYRG